MEIDRRSFLALGGGIGAGITLSPVMWKLMDDSSIWTQNWSWTPVPKDGKTTYANTVCTLCPGGCGITVRKVGQRVVKIEGMKDHPVNNGGICILGLAGPQLLYSPTRVKAPMIKHNDGFKKIPWSEAVEIVARKLAELRTDGNAHKVACIADTDKGTVPGLFKRFLTAYGSPNFICDTTAMDAYALTLKTMHGIEAVPGFDLENATYVLSFGSGLLDGWGSPVRTFQANSKWEKQGRALVQIDPRLSNTAAKADMWLPIKPGTEGILALGFAHTILKSGRYNNDFLTMSTRGFEEWKDIVLKYYKPEAVQDITGINAKTIEMVALEFMRSKHPVAICGRGEGASPGSIREFSAIHTLNILAGNINRKGGVLITKSGDTLSWAKPVMDAFATNGMRKDRVDGAQSTTYPDTKYRPNALPEIINKNSKENSPVNLLFVLNTNPVFTMPDTNVVKAAFEKIDFKVSFSTYMDETAAMCDLILPNHSYLERYEDVYVTAGLTRPMTALAQPVVKPQFDTRHTGDVIIALAKSMKGSIANSFPWCNYTECLQKTYELQLHQFKKNGYMVSAGSEATGSLAFPRPDKNIAGLMTAPEGKDNGDFNLTLIPSDSMRIAGNNIGTPPFLMKTVSDDVLKDNDILVEINPETAKELGLAAGKYAVLKTPKCKDGEKVKVFLNDGIGPNIISIPRGLGHTAYDKYLAGKGINFNQLIGPVVDPASGLDVAWGIRASLKS